jgi:hypothetical protein
MSYLWIKNAVKSQTITSSIQTHLAGVSKFINRELKRRPTLPLTTRLRAYRAGYLSESVPLFDLETKTDDGLISNYDWLTKTVQINGANAVIHDNKLHWYYGLYPAYPDRLPALYGYLNDGFCRLPFAETQYDTLYKAVSSENAVIAKPIDGTGGKGVTILQATDLDRPDIAIEFDGYLIQEVVQQASYAQSINPNATNTLRLITMVDPVTDEVFIGAAVHRFGVGESIVDNWSSGGIAAGIDPKTGQLSTAIGYPEDAVTSTYDIHPETDAQIAGRYIPSWEQVRDSVLEMAEYLAPLTPYIGWDVVVTSDSGDVIVLESNSNPDIDVIQPHVPLLGDKQRRRFYEHHGVL